MYMWVIFLLRKWICTLLCAVLFCCFTAPQPAFSAELRDSAAACVVVDAADGEIVYGHDAYARRSMASTTKIMTCLLACESGRLGETVKITKAMLTSEGSSAGLKAGDTVTLHDLVVAMLLASGNDAADAAAIYLAGSIEAFAEQMNARAALIGMHATTFVTPSGLDADEHMTTAYDMALLTMEALKNPVFASLCKLQRADITLGGEKVTLYNHNKLLSQIEGCSGVKTGYTKKSGRCLVTAVTRGHVTLICVTLNDPDDWQDHTGLYDLCFSQYRSVTVQDRITVDVVGSTAASVLCTYSGEVCVRDPQQLEIRLYYYPFLYAPVKKGDAIGTVLCYDNGNQIMELKIMAGESVNYVR